MKRNGTATAILASDSLGMIEGKCIQQQLASSFRSTMESSQMLKACLTCGCPDLDNLGDHARFCGGNGLAARLHTVVKWLLAPMVKAVAVDPSSGVSAVAVEQDGTVRNRLRPGDLAFKANAVDYAGDVYRTCCYGLKSSCST